MSKKLLTILEGAAVIALGILMAIFGGQAVLDVYFGVLFVIAGVGLIVFSITTLVKTKLLPFGAVFGACAATIIGSFLLANYYSFGYLVYTLVLLIIAAGFALALYGIYTIVKLSVVYGVGQIVIGAAAATLGFCYLFVAGFYTWFWIIVGVLVAVYGLVVILGALFNKKED